MLEESVKGISMCVEYFDEERFEHAEFGGGSA